MTRETFVFLANFSNDGKFDPNAALPKFDNDVFNAVLVEMLQNLAGCPNSDFGASDFNGKGCVRLMVFRTFGHESNNGIHRISRNAGIKTTTFQNEH